MRKAHASLIAVALLAVAGCNESGPTATPTAASPAPTAGPAAPTANAPAPAGASKKKGQPDEATSAVIEQ